MKIPAPNINQRPFRRAWGDALAKNLQLEKLGLIVVNMRDGVAWVIDGQHRVYALRENGFKGYEFECEVYSNLSDTDAANLFLGRNDSKAVNAFTRFMVGCRARYPVNMAIRHIVEDELGLNLSTHKQDGSVGCVGTLMTIYDRLGGETVLKSSLRILKEAFGGSSEAFKNHLLCGVAMVVSRYGNQLDHDVLVNALSSYQRGITKIMQDVEKYKLQFGQNHQQSAAALVVDRYNKTVGRRSSARLVKWFALEDD